MWAGHRRQMLQLSWIQLWKESTALWRQRTSRWICRRLWQGGEESNEETERGKRSYERRRNLHTSIGQMQQASREHGEVKDCSTVSPAGFESSAPLLGDVLLQPPESHPVLEEHADLRRWKDRTPEDRRLRSRTGSKLYKPHPSQGLLAFKAVSHPDTYYMLMGSAPLKTAIPLFCRELSMLQDTRSAHCTSARTIKY